MYYKQVEIVVIEIARYAIVTHSNWVIQVHLPTLRRARIYSLFMLS